MLSPNLNLISTQFGDLKRAVHRIYTHTQIKFRALLERQRNKTEIGKCTKSDGSTLKVTFKKRCFNKIAVKMCGTFCRLQKFQLGTYSD